MHKNNKFVTRSVALSVVFTVICLIYAIRLVNIRINAEPRNDGGEQHTRYETIQAVRGEIYDRNGKKLVSNKYTYDFVFDYSAMSGDRGEQNRHILQALYVMQSTQNYEKLTDNGFPFVGTYPDYSYSAEAVNESSNIYYRLLKRIAENELEDQTPKAKNQLTADYLDTFYKERPDAFPKESEIINFYLEKYRLVDEKGVLVYSNEQTDMLLRVRYSMEVADFSPYSNYVMAKDVDELFITHIEELCLPGADFEIITSRVYEYPGYASHILGRTGKIYAENWEHYKELGYDMDDVVGIDGCEYAFENYLRGIDGVMLVTEDADGNILSKEVQTQPVAGQDIYLTIDIDLQIAAEKSLERSVNDHSLSEESGGALVAMDPNTGGILALASYPTYDLTTFSADYSSLVQNKAQPLRNRALEQPYAPGSTFKLGLAAIGIDGGAVGANETIECAGVYQPFGTDCWIYNSSSSVKMHGHIVASQAICVSCNCYFYELGLRVGIDKMNSSCRLLGLGESTGVELYERTGILDGPLYRESQGYSAWQPIETVYSAIGQAKNEFTPIQLASYVSTLLNGGKRYSCTLLGKTTSFEGEDIYVPTKQVLSSINLSDTAISTVKQGMKQMVEESATASVYMKNIPVTVGGKTGTAEIGGGDMNGLFVCAAPYNNPEIVIASVIENTGGGSYAVSAAAHVLEEYYSN